MEDDTFTHGSKHRLQRTTYYQGDAEAIAARREEIVSAVRYAMGYESRTSRRLFLDPGLILKLFTSPSNCDALLGDLEERHRLIRKKFGKHQADFWYLQEAMRSIVPIAWAASGAALKRLSGLQVLAAIWKRIRH